VVPAPATFARSQRSLSRYRPTVVTVHRLMFIGRRPIRAWQRSSRTQQRQNSKSLDRLTADGDRLSHGSDRRQPDSDSFQSHRSRSPAIATTFSLASTNSPPTAAVGPRTPTILQVAEAMHRSQRPMPRRLRQSLTGLRRFFRRLNRLLPQQQPDSRRHRPLSRRLNGSPGDRDHPNGAADHNHGETDRFSCR
jgi:hypothetical protein